MVHCTKHMHTLTELNEVIRALSPVYVMAMLLTELIVEVFQKAEGKPR